MTQYYIATFNHAEKNVTITIINGWAMRIDNGAKYYPESFTNLKPVKLYYRRMLRLPKERISNLK